VIANWIIPTGIRLIATAHVAFVRVRMEYIIAVVPAMATSVIATDVRAKGLIRGKGLTRNGQNLTCKGILYMTRK
jgi:hypothetical protein